MSRKLYELSDDELSKLTPDQIAEMAAAETADTTSDDGDAGKDDGDEGSNGSDEGNTDDDKNPSDEEVQRLAAESAAADAAKKNDADDDLEDDTKKDDASNGDKADKGDADSAAKDGKPADKAAKPAEKTDPAAKVDDPAKTEVVNFEEKYKELLAPFKANGREIQVADVGEARQLMQMGANYNKKMQAMKPHLATLRTLENAKIGEAELSYLIDLHRKDPAAINKLVKESGIDPLDLSADKADGYKPGNHRASDAEVELESVLTDLEGSEGLTKTINVVTTQWDSKSKDFIAQNPQVLRFINAHVEAGIYDLVANEVERRKTFGQLAGLSDFDAYRQVGEQMNEDGKFAHLGGSSTKGQQAPAAKVIDAPDPKKADDDKRKEQKRGAAPAKAAAPAPKTPDFNPLSVSDEEFAKLTLKT